MKLTTSEWECLHPIFHPSSSIAFLPLFSSSLTPWGIVLSPVLLPLGFWTFGIKWQWIFSMYCRAANRNTSYFVETNTHSLRELKNKTMIFNYHNMNKYLAWAGSFTCDNHYQFFGKFLLSENRTSESCRSQGTLVFIDKNSLF